MSKTIRIGDVIASVGDYISFKKEMVTEGQPGSILEWSNYTYKYSGTILSISDTMVRLESPSGDKGWATAGDGVTAIEHRPHREVGYWELTLKLTLSNRELTGVHYWDGTKWRDTPNGCKVAVGNYKFSKEHYLGSSGIESN